MRDFYLILAVVGGAMLFGEKGLFGEIEQADKNQLGGPDQRATYLTIPEEFAVGSSPVSGRDVLSGDGGYDNPEQNFVDYTKEYNPYSSFSDVVDVELTNPDNFVDPTAKVTFGYPVIAKTMANVFNALTGREIVDPNKTVVGPSQLHESYINKDTRFRAVADITGNPIAISGETIIEDTSDEGMGDLSVRYDDGDNSGTGGGYSSQDTGGAAGEDRGGFGGVSQGGFTDTVGE